VEGVGWILMHESSMNANESVDELFLEKKCVQQELLTMTTHKRRFEVPNGVP
jgi:hypothetical protein